MSRTDITPLVAIFKCGGGELILLAMIALVLFGLNYLPTFLKGLKQGGKEFRKASKDVQRELGVAIANDHGPAAFHPVADALTHTNQKIETDPPPEPPTHDPLLVWIAQGFGSGRLKPGPGTWGSIVGLLWFAGLVETGSLWGYFGGILLSIPLSVWICGLAEKALGEQDPGSVVMDEIIAIPLCFCGWVMSHVHHTGRMPDAGYFFSAEHWLGVVGIFAAFRLFDIWKPWPVRQSQSLPGGWGVTVDDLLAALYVALLTLPFLG